MRSGSPARRARAGEEAEVRNAERDKEVQPDLYPCERRVVPVDKDVEFVDQREHEPDDERDPERAPQVLGAAADRTCATHSDERAGLARGQHWDAVFMRIGHVK
jgi:hypothetical protein